MIPAPSSSNFMTVAESVPTRRPTSSLTAAKISSGRTPCATSVATRRNAACSSANLVRDPRPSAFAIAVPTSSVNFSRRSSVSDGSGCWPWTAMAPQSRPSTTIGLAAAEMMPRRRWMWPVDPDQRRSATGRASGAVHLEGSHPVLELPVHSDREGSVDLAGGADVADPLTVIVVPDDRRRFRTDQAHDLVADRREDLVGSDSPGHPRRHAPELCLLCVEAFERFPRLSILDRGRQQGGEVGQPRRGVVRQRLRLPGGTDDGSPETTGDDDRGSDGRTDSGATDDRRHLAR